MSVADWAVLGLIAEAPSHGFALAGVLAPDGALGRVWTVGRPAVYQSLAKLSDRGWVRAVERTASPRGPSRSVLAVTPAGVRALEGWLVTPVDHVRDVRSELLVKLALADRRGDDPGALLEAQRRHLETALVALDATVRSAVGFERVLAEWRRASHRAAIDFVRSVDRLTG